MISIEEILTSPPPGVDLTLVGGQALVYWTLVYQERYPEVFPDEVISSTTDVDFLLQLKQACEECHKHWGGVFYDAGWAATPEYGYIVVESEDGDEPVRIDLLEYMHGLDRDKIKKHRTLIGVGGDERYKDMYVLTEMGTLLNRVFNTISQKRYTRPEAIVQLHNSLAVVEAGILWRMENDINEAQRLIKQVVDYARMSQYGMRIYLEHGIDLLATLPLDNGRFDPKFTEYVLDKGVQAVRDKQKRLTADRARRASERKQS